MSKRQSILDQRNSRARRGISDTGLNQSKSASLQLLNRLLPVHAHCTLHTALTWYMLMQWASCISIISLMCNWIEMVRSSTLQIPSFDFEVKMCVNMLLDMVWACYESESQSEYESSSHIFLRIWTTSSESSIFLSMDQRCYHLFTAPNRLRTVCSN